MLGFKYCTVKCCIYKITLVCDEPQTLDSIQMILQYLLQLKII